MFKLVNLIVLLTLSSVIFAQRSSSIDKSFENITNVEVNVVISDVVIQSAPGDVVHLKGNIEWERDKDEYQINTHVSGTTLVIEVKHPRSSKGKVSGKIDISVPKMTDADVNSVSGDINVTDIGQRKVKCNTVSGDIVAKKINSDISVNTVSGDILLDEIKGNAKSNTVSGDAELLNIDGNLKGNSVSGDFIISNLKGNREISTLSGSIR